MAANNTPAVLVVDDSHSTTMIIREFLRQMGHENVDEAHDGETALQRARAKRYAWVISDLHMQPVNGMELLRQLRAEQGARGPQFVFVTGENKWSSQTTARDLGAHAFIQKPQRTMALRERIAAIFGENGLASAQSKGGEPEPAPMKWPARKATANGLLRGDRRNQD
jgi:two-component system chemotaxis response regulator CheY